MEIRLALACLSAYLLGAIPFGMLITLLVAKRDVRAVGSGNIGATNVARAAGRTAGIATLLLDAAKGALAAYVGLRFFGAAWGGMLLGGAAFFGHVFPVYLGFRGGKGVATGLGVFAVLAPVAALVGLATYAVVFALTRVSALGSLVGLAAVGVVVAFREPRLLVLYAACAAVMVWRHRRNLQELRRGRRSS